VSYPYYEIKPSEDIAGFGGFILSKSKNDLNDFPENISNLFNNQTLILKEGKFSIRELCYHSVNGELLLSIYDAKTTLLDRCLNVFSLFTNINLFSNQNFIAYLPDKIPLFSIKRKRGLNDHFNIHLNDQTLIAEIKGATKLKFELEVKSSEEKLGIITGDSNWWTFDSYEGIRYLDYKKDSFLPNYKHNGKFIGPNVIKLSNIQKDEKLLLVTLAIPFIIEIIYLNQQT
jgi:hypothetical protein